MGTISIDPIGIKAGDPNFYRYVGNSPTNATDPLGLQEKAPLTAGAIENLPDRRPYLEEIGFDDYFVNDLVDALRVIVTVNSKRVMRAAPWEIDRAHKDIVQDILHNRAVRNGEIPDESGVVNAVNPLFEWVGPAGKSPGKIGGFFKRVKSFFWNSGDEASKSASTGSAQGVVNAARLRSQLALQQRLARGGKFVNPAGEALQVGQSRVAVFDRVTGKIFYDVSNTGIHTGVLQRHGLPSATGRYVGGFLESTDEGRLVFELRSGTFPFTDPDLPSARIIHQADGEWKPTRSVASNSAAGHFCA